LEKEVKLVTKLGMENKNKKFLAKTFLKIGGIHKDDVPDKKHKGEEFILVVNGSFKRTLKVIDIIGHGAPIVSENWLRACEKADMFVGKANCIYILTDFN
jgi:BRCA1 C Terminus (BRCT) domain